MSDSNDLDELIVLGHIRLVGMGYIIAAIFNFLEFVKTAFSYHLQGVFGLANFSDYAIQNNIKPSVLETTILIAYSGISFILMMLQIIAYLQIRKRKHIYVCISVSIISIISVPVGTIIGLAGLLALVRRSTRLHFD